jgi:phage regulator Rha-like protein
MLPNAYGWCGLNTITANDTVESATADLALTTTKDAARVDSRLVAQHLGNQHRHVMALIEKYADKFRGLNQLLFKNAVGERLQGGGNPERFALLTEDQAYFLLSLSRNSERVVHLKLKLIEVFGAARRANTMRQVEYLPTYHQLHHTVHQLAMESSNEKFVHMNVNKLVNKAAGVEAGQRASASLPQQAMLIVCQDLATKAMHGATDHHDGYQRAKLRLQALAAVTLLGGGDA